MAVRPAQSAAGDGSAAQVDALRRLRVHEDLDPRPRLGQQRDRRGVELERQRVGAHPVVRAQDRSDHGEIQGQDPVLVEARDGLDLRDDPSVELLGAGGVRMLGIQARREQLDEHPRDVGVREQRRHEVVVAERRAALTQVAGDGAQHDRVSPLQARAEDEPVDAVAREPAGQRAPEHVLEGLAHVVADLGVHDRIQSEVRDVRDRGVDRRDLVRPLVGHPHAHVLEDRDDVRELERRLPRQHPAAQAVDAAVEPDIEPARPVEVVDRADVPHGLGDRVVGAVHDRERRRVAPPVVGAAAARAPAQREAQVVGPAAGRLRDPLLDLPDVDVGDVARLRRDDDVQPHEHRLGEPQVEVRAGPVDGVAQDLLDLQPVVGVEALAGQVDEEGDEALELVAARRTPARTGARRGRGSRSRGRRASPRRPGRARRAGTCRGCPTAPSRRGRQGAARPARAPGAPCAARSGRR